jgi:hypothetical protein
MTTNPSKAEYAHPRCATEGKATSVPSTELRRQVETMTIVHAPSSACCEIHPHIARCPSESKLKLVGKEHNQRGVITSRSWCRTIT